MKFKIVSYVLFHLMIALWEKQAIRADTVVLRRGSMEKKGREIRFFREILCIPVIILTVSGGNWVASFSLYHAQSLSISGLCTAEGHMANM